MLSDKNLAELAKLNVEDRRLPFPKEVEDLAQAMLDGRKGVINVGNFFPDTETEVKFMALLQTKIYILHIEQDYSRGNYLSKKIFCACPEFDVCGMGVMLPEYVAEVNDMDKSIKFKKV